MPFNRDLLGVMRQRMSATIAHTHTGSYPLASPMIGSIAWGIAKNGADHRAEIGSSPIQGEALDKASRAPALAESTCTTRPACDD